MGLRALYGGRHLRTTMVLAGASTAAGALTGAIGIGMAGTPASHDTQLHPSEHSTPGKHHHPATKAATPGTRVRVTTTTTKSATPTPTVTATATATHPSAPSTAPTTAAPSTSAPASQPPTDPASPPASTPPSS